MGRQAKKEKRITIRLNPEAELQLQEAKDKGYTTSQYVNALMTGTTVVNLSQRRKFIAHLCELENLLEHQKNSRIKEAMREEVNELWRSLKLSKGNM